MNETEDRLLARIDARRALATVLTARQRHVLCRHMRHGETIREIAEADGVSPTRIYQIMRRSWLLLGSWRRRALAELSRQPPQAKRAAPIAFDKAAFLEHMRGVIARRQAEADAEFERDAAELARMVQREQQKQQTDTDALVAAYKAQAQAKFAALAKPVAYKVPAYKVHPAHVWPPPQPIAPPDLQWTATRALSQLVALLPTLPPGVPTLGTYCTNCVFPWRTGSAIEAMRQLVSEIPPDARISACPFTVPPGYQGANATNGAGSVRVMMESNGQMMRLDVTWDAGPKGPVAE